MAKKELEQINGDLSNARDFIKSAARRAERVGDKSGAAKIMKHDSEVEKTQTEFTQKGK